MTSKIATCLLVLACATPSGCGGGDPADVAGDFTIALTNRENGCGFNDWQENDTSSNIPLTITQDGEAITGTVGGAAGGLLNLWLGSNVYQGTAGSSDLAMTIYGTRSATDGNCTYTFNSTIEADIDGDLLQGDILYTAATNGNPDCETQGREECVTRQEFNGTRPPQ